MTEFWQDLAIASVVGGAVTYLVVRFIGWRSRRRACDECRLRELVAGGGERRRGC